MPAKMRSISVASHVLSVYARAGKVVRSVRGEVVLIAGFMIQPPFHRPDLLCP